MTEEDEEFERLQREREMRQANCKHRWEESEFGKQYWAPGTYQYTCKRCGKMSMGVLNGNSEAQR